MKMTAPRSPKFRKLERLTSMSKRELVGTLELLWLFVMEHAPASDVGKWSDSDIEFECDWQGDEGALISALVEAGWLDECQDHRLVVHDWEDHLPEFLRLRVSRNTLKVVKANPPNSPQGENVRRSSDQRTTDVEREGKGREAKGREDRPSESDSEPKESGEWIVPMLALTAKSTEAERSVWFESVWAEILATAEIDQSRDGGDIHKHRQRYAIRKWNAYLKTRDPSQRQFAREAQAQESAAALAASKASEAESASSAREPPDDDDPLADLLPFQKTQTQDTAS